MIHFALPIGKKLGQEQYEIVKILGRGGFGITYLVKQLKGKGDFFVIKECFLNGLCVRQADDSLKAMTIEEEEFVNYKTKFLQEAKLLMEMEKNPHIISVVHYFEENNTAYLVMPYETEETLEKYCQNQPNQRLPEAEVLDYAFQLIAALKTLHKNNILHQDIKPSNILRNADGQLILIDFGTAKEWMLTSRSRTLTANAIISPGYAPPEAYNPSAAKGSYSDIYGLAATLYRMLTGKVPLDATSRSIEELPFISDYVQVASFVEKAIHHALTLKPAHRFQTVETFGQALKGEKFEVNEHNVETINYQLLQKQAENLFQQEQYEAALTAYQNIAFHFPKVEEVQAKITALRVLLTQQQKKHQIRKYLIFSVLGVVLLGILGIVLRERLTTKKQISDTLSASTDTTNHVSEADVTPPMLTDLPDAPPIPALDSAQLKKGIDSVAFKESLVKKMIGRADSAMQKKNYQAAQQAWLEVLSLQPKNKYVKQQMAICEKEIQKELLKQLPTAATTTPPEAIQPAAANPSPIKSYGKIYGLKDSEGQVFDYEGEIVNSQPNGKGKLWYKNGSMCEGLMQNAKLNGSCTCTFSNGDRYLGTVKNDRREGRGIYFYTKLGSRYIGEWLNDRQHGKGTWYYENGDKYEAEFVNGHPKGTIKYMYHTGEVILGRWENGKFSKLGEKQP